MLDTDPSLPPGDDALDAPVLDRASLAQLRALDPAGGSAFILRVMDTYQRSLERHVNLIRQAHAARDLDGLSRAVHTLKAASASIGALGLAARCEVIELQIRNDQPVGLDDQVQGFLAEALQVGRAVGAYLDSAAAP